jgi:hypothetical protein
MASMNGAVARVWKSIRKHSWLAVAFLALCSIVMQPGTSTAAGLARYTCLPAATAIGRLDWMEERRALNGDGVELLLQQAAIG